MFNGIQHPAICTFEPRTGELEVVRSFGYQDFKARLS
jgi:carboxynorspermidine decarboxylase